MLKEYKYVIFSNDKYYTAIYSSVYAENEKQAQELIDYQTSLRCSDKKFKTRLCLTKTLDTDAKLKINDILQSSLSEIIYKAQKVYAEKSAALYKK